MKKQAEKKRILVVCQHFWPETFRINDIVDYLASDKAVEVDVLCGIPNYPSGKFTNGYSYTKNRKQKHHGVTIRRVFEIPRGDNSNVRIFLNYISFPIASLFHIPRLLTKKYDKILLYQLSPVMMSISGLIVGKIKRTETVMYVLDLWPENLYSVIDIKNRFLRKIAEVVSHWHYRSADKLIALSETMKKKLLDITSLDNEKIIVLPQAPEKIYESEQLDITLQERFSGSFNIVFAGNLSPAQSFQTIIKAASTLKNKGYSDIHWIIVGDGMSRTEIESEVKRRGLQDIFSFEGQRPIEDIPKYTAIANGLVGCLVKSELLEATVPAKVMSYIAAGKPLLLAMDGEVQTLINDTIQGGFAGPAQDHEALSNNVEKLYKLSLKERAAISVRLKKYHNAHFERNLILGKLYQFIFS